VDLVTEGTLLKDPDFAEDISGTRVSLYAVWAYAPHPAPDRRRLLFRPFGDRRKDAQTLKDYTGERLLRQGIERNLQINGEAVGRLRRDDPQTADRLTEHERIVGFRNVLVHGYDLVDDRIVWDTIKNNLPVLLSEVEELQQELEERDSEEGEASR
jgi:uncharacterized protein with HEPN domain